MSPDLKLITQLQGVDRKIGELRRAIDALPKHLAEIEKALEVHSRRLEADRTVLLVNQKDRRRFEADVQAEEEKISRLKTQMLDAKTNEQYRIFQREIEHCEVAIRKAEDRLLELMGEAEALEQNVASAEVALNEEKKQVEEEKKHVQKEAVEDRRLLEDALKERKDIAAGISPLVYAAYEGIRKRIGGEAVAEVVEGHCSACHIALRPQLYQDLKVGAQVIFCESCRRILFENPPVDVEEGLEAR